MMAWKSKVRDQWHHYLQKQNMMNNIRAIYMADNNMLNNQTKHMNSKYHFVRELIENGTVKVEFIRSENNYHDIFTKNLGRELFTKHSNKFMSKEYNEHNTDNVRWTTQDRQCEIDAR
jgi:hypothetical protein